MWKKIIFVEILGALLDNAAETPLRDDEKTKVALIISETKKDYLFAVQHHHIDASSLTTKLQMNKKELHKCSAHVRSPK